MSNERIKSAFERTKAFIPFITCGDPDLETTAKAAYAAAQNGADLIILGIPFSDPTAEGPVIQGANIRALSGGATTGKVFETVSELRRITDIPIVFMTYANVVFSKDSEYFISTCAEIGVDGLFLPDIPFEEKEEFLGVCQKYGISLISAVAPSSENRIGMIAREAEGFIYLLSDLSGKNEMKPIVGTIRDNTSIPCAVVLETASPEQAAEAAAIADGVIVTSDVVKLLEKHGKASPEHIGEYVAECKKALG